MTAHTPLPPGVTADDRLWAALAYFTAPIGPLIVLALPERRARPYIRNHNRQALIFGLLLTLVVALLYLPSLGLSLVLYALDWFYAWRAYHGELFSIPGITTLLRRQQWF
jgi:uncharacterized membrane protein